MEADLSFVHLVTNASPVVQLVMLLLVAVSVLSWALMFRKGMELKQARHAAQGFESRFWSGVDLNQVYKELATRAVRPGGLESIFEAGFKEFVRLRRQPGVDPQAVVEGSQRAMRVALSRETDALESSLPFLATVGSVSPYVGLFGTVWGIMNSFRALGNVHQATLAQVAPGIAEALIATAMGLFAAIPAVIAYNRYAAELERMITRYDNFLEEFSSVLHRQAHS